MEKTLPGLPSSQVPNSLVRHAEHGWLICRWSIVHEAQMGIGFSASMKNAAVVVVFDDEEEKLKAVEWVALA